MKIPTMTQKTGPTTSLGADTDAARRTALRRMQAVALGLLLFAAVVYVLTHGREGWLGFGHAGAEARIAGAIAGWFAVNALVPRPVGPPPPHTRPVPRSQDTPST